MYIYAAHFSKITSKKPLLLQHEIPKTMIIATSTIVVASITTYTKQPKKILSKSFIFHPLPLQDLHRSSHLHLL